MLPSPLSSSTPPNPEPEVETPHFEQEDDLHHDVDVPESEEYTSGSEDDADFDVPFPSSDANIRPIKKVRVPKPRGVRGGNKWRSKMGKDEEERERTRQPCYLLELPTDVLHLILASMPPRSLLRMGSTCRLLHAMLQKEAPWRQCYMNHFLWDGAAFDPRAREEAAVLVQGCMGTGGRGWKREALSREAMVDRWINSRTSTVVHHPVNVLIHTMSLAYPPPTGSAKPLVVGKMTGVKTPASEPSPSMTPTKMSHRQKYETMLAAASRPPPTLYSVGLDNSALMKSDPLSGKVSKGFWGPGQDANFHLHPHWDPSAAPVAVYLPHRSQTHMLWGQLNGAVVHTTMQTRSHGSHTGRAHSVNIYSKAADVHIGAITAIAQPEGEMLKWATGGEDGRVKYWQLTPAVGRSGKKTPTEQPGSMECVFTSGVVEAPFKERAEDVRLRQMAHPDAIVAVTCDPAHDVVAGVTEDGDLRVWFDAVSASANASSETETVTAPREVRIDVGSADEFGGVKHLLMSCASSDDNSLVASLVVHYTKHPELVRYDISVTGTTHTVRKSAFTTPSEFPLTIVDASLTPSPGIAAPPSVETTLSARIITPASATSASATASGAATPTPQPQADLAAALEDLPRRLVQYGRFIVAGDEQGHVHIWAWETRGRVSVPPMRSFAAADGKITAIDYYCGLVAVGSYDGHYAVFDPLPLRVERLRALRPRQHYTPGELQLAASDEPRARYYTVNDILVDNDLVIAAIGRNVQTWRAGTAKGRQSGKETAGARKASAPGRERGPARTLDLRDLHHDAVESHYEIQAENEIERHSVSHEQAHRAALADLGLADGDAALQYALMLSQETGEQSGLGAGAGAAPEHENECTGYEGYEDDSAYNEYPDEMSDAEADAIRAVEAFMRAEQEAQQPAPAPAPEGEDPEDLAEILEMIRLAEERERNS